MRTNKDYTDTQAKCRDGVLDDNNNCTAIWLRGRIEDLFCMVIRFYIKNVQFL